MPIKWVQCRYCARTNHIDAFPEPDHRRLKKTGIGVCKQCQNVPTNVAIGSKPLQPFYDFMKANKPHDQ